jgi:alkylation response protein AidB-like acyl-CoA dehydrogenase
MSEQPLMGIVDELGPTFAGRIAAYDADDAFVAENYRALKERKVFSAMVPKDLGGGGYRHSEMCAFLRGLAKHCSSTALACSMHQHLVAAQVWNHLHGKPGGAMLEKVAQGGLVLVSTGANDWLESNGTVEKVEGGYRVTAKKPFASGSPAGDLLVTSAPYEHPTEGWQVLHFPVPFSTKGVSLKADWKVLGMRATGSNTVALDGVFVPEGAVGMSRPRGDYHPFFNVVMTVALPLISSVYLGVAEAIAEKARNGAKKRQADASVPYLLGELENALTTAQLAVDSMVRIANDWDFEAVTEVGNAIAIRKSIAVRAVLGTAEKALEVVGGTGFFREAGLERLLRDAHGFQFHPLQEKRQHQFTGRIALGLEPLARSTT